MRQRFLTAALLLTMMMYAFRAKADSSRAPEGPSTTLLLITTAVLAAVEVPTGIATYQNMHVASQHTRPSSAWMSVGAMGGLLNVVLGVGVMATSLPETQTRPCFHIPPSEPPKLCSYQIPANYTGIAISTLFLGVGILALGSTGWAIKNAPDGQPSAGSPPGSSPTMVGFSLPPLQF